MTSDWMEGGIARIPDRVRGGFLRVTLRLPAARRIFRTRSIRLRWLYAAAFLGALVTSVLFPLWVLVIGPVVWGLPHLVSSLRYVPYRVAGACDRNAALKRRSYSFFAVVFGGIASYRLMTELGVVQTPELHGRDDLPELASMLLIVGGCAWLYRRSVRQTLAALALLGSFAWVWWSVPVEVAGALVLVHGLAAFAYWVDAARTRADRRVALGATAAFLIANVLIFGGAFDRLSALFAPRTVLLAADLSATDVGRLIAPWSSDHALHWHCVVAYAFGQALHYFVWMKAIPEQHSRSPTPVSFRKSYRELVDDFGGALTIVCLVAVVAGVLVWTLVSLPEARVAYFAVASYHTYQELAGLMLVFRPNTAVAQSVPAAGT